MNKDPYTNQSLQALALTEHLKKITVELDYKIDCILQVVAEVNEFLVNHPDEAGAMPEIRAELTVREKELEGVLVKSAGALKVAVEKPVDFLKGTKRFRALGKFFGQYIGSHHTSLVELLGEHYIRKSQEAKQGDQR